MPDPAKKTATALSKKGADLIKKFEGLVLHPYLDGANAPTIGWGTTQYENGKKVSMKDKTITEERAEELFQFEAKSKAFVLAEGLQKFNITLTQNQFDALLSLSYNIGIEGLLGSTLFRLIKKDPQDTGVRTAFGMWNKITVNGKKVVANGLTTRRTKEADFYLS